MKRLKIVWKMWLLGTSGAVVVIVFLGSQAIVSVPLTSVWQIVCYGLGFKWQSMEKKGSR